MQDGWNKAVKLIIKRYVVGACCILLTSLALAKLSGSLAPEAIAERLKPMGQVIISGEQPGANPAAATLGGVGSPKDIYENNCKMCHQAGIAGAPRFGNKQDWAPRISQGLDTLVKTAIVGIRAMPPKGNCLKCTPDEIKATVEYMLNAAQ